VNLEAEKLRIAVLSIHSSPIGELGTKDTGGMSVYIRELARELGKLGHRVDIYTRFHGPSGEREVQLYDNVRIIYLSAGFNGNSQKLALYPHLPHFLRELERFRTRNGLHYDLIHSHYWLSGRVGNWAQALWNVPHILKFHTLSAVKNNTAGSEQEPELRMVTEKRLAKTCHRILAATERERKQLMHYYDVPWEIIGVVPCGVNLDLFRPMDKAKARERLGFGHDGSILLYVGRFAPLKGIEKLLEAMTFLRHHQRLQLVIIGGDGYHSPESQNLRRLSRKLGIQDVVAFGGRIEQENLPTYYNAADVLVVPSYYESFGLVALESLACGTPVVATKVGAMESILRENETGHVVHNGSPRLLANGIEGFLPNSITKPLSAAAIRETVLRFGWANVASDTIEEYQAVLREHQFASASIDMGFVSLNRSAHF
jgi:D-inositol-3-phosphate glycosyltransferase